MSEIRYVTRENPFGQPGPDQPVLFQTSRDSPVQTLTPSSPSLSSEVVTPGLTRVEVAPVLLFREENNR